MGILNRIFGSDDTQQQAPAAQPAPTTPTPQAAGTQPGAPATSATQPSSDEMAVARYRYMLKTAPPETLEQAHQEAFAKLTPEQRRLALQQLAQVDPEAQNITTDDPQTLARLATRAEVRQPGFMERTFGGGIGGGGGIGLGGMVAGGFLSSIAGTLVGSAIAQSFFANPMHAAGFAQSGLAPGGVDTGDTTINNYYGDNAAGGNGTAGDAAAPADNSTAVGGTSTGDVASSGDTGSDPDVGGLSDMMGTDMGGDLGDLGGFDV